MILPALLEANAPGYRPIKYALFPPLGFAGLASYLDDNDKVEPVDEHVQTLSTDDEPDLVVMTVYITSATGRVRDRRPVPRAGRPRLSRQTVPTSLPARPRSTPTPSSSAQEDTWPSFLRDFRKGVARGRYVSEAPTLKNVLPLHRDLIDRRRYLCPNSLVVSRGCPLNLCECCVDGERIKGATALEERILVVEVAVVRLGGTSTSSTTISCEARRFATAFFDGMRRPVSGIGVQLG